MNSMEFNKIAAGLIAAGLLYLLLNFFSTAIYGTGGFAEHAVDEEHGPVLAYAVAIEGAEAGAAEEEPQIDLLALFRDADPAAGERTFRACGACHAVEPGVNKVGPTLHGVVGADVAAVDGFNYSDALAGMEGHWTPERLSGFLENPQAFAPGTKMSYAGMNDPEDRANVIAYLNQTGDAPVDLTEGLEPLESAGEAAPGLDMPPTEVTPGTGPGQDPREPAAGVGSADAPQGDAEQEVPVVTPEAATETTSTTTAGQIEAEVTDTEIVDLGDEDVEVESTTPLEIVEERGPDTVADPEAERVLPDDNAGTQAETPATEERAADAPAAQPSAEAGTAMLAGDPDAGERLFRRCAACHTLEDGQNRVGPHLAGVVGRAVASVEGFNYSDALREHGGEWTPERLSEFLTDPKAAVPGNKMAFPGLRDEQDRTDLITYIQQAGE